MRYRDTLRTAIPDVAQPPDIDCATCLRWKTCPMRAENSYCSRWTGRRETAAGAPREEIDLAALEALPIAGLDI